MRACDAVDMMALASFKKASLNNLIYLHQFNFLSRKKGRNVPVLVTKFQKRKSEAELRSDHQPLENLFLIFR